MHAPKAADGRVKVEGLQAIRRGLADGGAGAPWHARDHNRRLSDIAQEVTDGDLDAELVAGCTPNLNP